MKLHNLLYEKHQLMMPAGDGGGGGGGTEVPQPLIITQKYSSRNAVIVDLAMRLYMNSVFDGPNAKPSVQCAYDAIVRAQDFVDAAGGMINDIIDE